MITIANAFKDFQIVGLQTLPIEHIIQLLQYGVMSGNSYWAESNGAMRKVKELLSAHPELKADDQIRSLLKCFNLNITNDNRLEKFDYDMADLAVIAAKAEICNMLCIDADDLKKYNFSCRFNQRCGVAIDFIKKHL